MESFRTWVHGAAAAAASAISRFFPELPSDSLTRTTRGSSKEVVRRQFSNRNTPHRCISVLGIQVGLQVNGVRQIQAG